MGVAAETKIDQYAEPTPVGATSDHPNPSNEAEKGEAPPLPPKTVGDLIAQLQKFDPASVVAYRKAEKDGGFVDYTLHSPSNEFNPFVVVLQGFQPLEMADEKAVS